MAINIRMLALLPGDRLVVRDSSNSSVVSIYASNQSVVHRRLQRPRSLPWNHALLFFTSRVAIEYWPSLSTLVLPIDRKQRDNPVVVIESFTYAFRRRVGCRSINVLGNEDSVESQIGATNEMKPAVCYKSRHQAMYKKAQAVARLIIRQTSDPSEAGLDQNANEVWTFCTGWLVGRGNHLLTNYHCFNQLSQMRTQSTGLRIGGVGSTERLGPCHHAGSGSANDDGSVRLRLSLEADVNFLAESKTCSGTGSTMGQLDPSRVEIVAAIESLDFCLLRLVTNNGTDRNATDLAKKFGYLTLRPRGPVNGEAIYIPQHPNGELKTIASVKNGRPPVVRVASSRVVEGVDNDTVWYNADTAPGSSGSPVISQRDNTVVALHRAGPGIYHPSLLSRLGGQQPQLNSGIRIDAIIEDLRAHNALPPCAVAEKCLTHAAATKPRSPCCSRTW